MKIELSMTFLARILFKDNVICWINDRCALHIAFHLLSPEIN